MNVYLLEAEGEQDYVEAESFSDAIQSWARDKVRQFGAGDDSDWDLGSEPESCIKVSAKPVIRYPRLDPHVPSSETPADSGITSGPP